MVGIPLLTGCESHVEIAILLGFNKIIKVRTPLLTGCESRVETMILVDLIKN